MSVLGKSLFTAFVIAFVMLFVHVFGFGSVSLDSSMFISYVWNMSQSSLSGCQVG